MGNYLYNSVELPELPTWDKTTYPYAVISTYQTFNGIRYEFTVSAVIPNGLKYADNPFARFFHVYLPAMHCHCYVGDERWSDLTAISESDATPSGNDYIVSECNPKWANFDFYYKDGTLCIAASDPVPVEPEEPEQPEPTTAPTDFYKIKNGAWQKQDTYKPVDDQWVKQPQGAIVCEDGAWSALS